MTKPTKPLDNIIRFPTEKVPKFGLERVKQRKKTADNLEQLGQMNLFGAPGGEVLRLPTKIRPFDEALMLDDRGEETAAELYRKAIESGDSIADAFCNLGVMEFGKGRTSEAFDCFTDALKHDTRHFESHYNVANLYFEAGELRPARLHYEVASEIDSEFPNVYFNLGLVEAMSENFKAAIEALTTYKELAPNSEGSKADELLASLKKSIINHT